MGNNDIESAENSEVELGHLKSDLSFATRALRAHLRRENSNFYLSHGIEAGGVAILSLIGLNPGISQKDLAGTIVLKKSAMTKVVNHMEKQGLIERRKGVPDMRVNALHLTEDGTRLYQSLMSDMRARQEKLLSALSEKERNQFFEMTWRLIAALDEQSDS